jgi:hypothetical protein
MREWLFVSLYGALFFIGLFLAPFWAFLACKRVKRIAGRWTVSSDRYFMLAAAISVLSFGETLVFGARTWGNMTLGLSAILRDGWDAVIIGTGLSLVLVGKIMLVWLADLERQPPIWSWTRLASVATVGWGIAAVVIQLIT